MHINRPYVYVSVVVVAVILCVWVMANRRANNDSPTELAKSILVASEKKNLESLNDLLRPGHAAEEELRSIAQQWNLRANSEFGITIHPEADYQGTIVFDNEPQKSVSIRREGGGRSGGHWFMDIGCPVSVPSQSDPQCSHPRY